MKNIRNVLIFFFVLTALKNIDSIHAQTFRDFDKIIEKVLKNSEPKILQYKFIKDDQIRILSTVEEDIFINENFIHHATILNRISAKTTDVDENGSGTTQAMFMTSEKSSTGKGVFEWNENYKSIFKRNPQGIYEIEDIYFMPVVRDIPIFPKHEIKPGDKWIASGHEAHDLRRSFNLQTPYKVPFTAQYEYLGDLIEKDGSVFCLIEVKYKLHYKSPQNISTQNYENLAYAPQSTIGESNQRILWNFDRGQIERYAEEFNITIETFSGELYRFHGEAYAEVQEFTSSATEENVKEIEEIVSKFGLEDITVSKTEEGLTISIEKIQFEPDSSILLDSEKIKLNHIAEILKNFDNDLLITGYCAARGNTKERQRISKERAEAVAGYLIHEKIRDYDKIFTIGKGSDNPIADNTTEEGRARNRRVEITIMDK